VSRLTDLVYYILILLVTQQCLRCTIVYCPHVCTLANHEHLRWRASLCRGVIACCSENELGSRFPDVYYIICE
jgi:hypothetical protein